MEHSLTLKQVSRRLEVLSNNYATAIENIEKLKNQVEYYEAILREIKFEKGMYQELHEKMLMEEYNVSEERD